MSFIPKRIARHVDMVIVKNGQLRLGLIIIFFMIPWTNICAGPVSMQGAVVQVKSGGRFGDNILSVAHALYFAQKNNLELLYDPFPYSNRLALSASLKPYFPMMDGQFQKIIIYPGGPAMANEYVYGGKNTLFKIPYFPDAPIEFRVYNTWQPFPVDWDDPEFKSALIKLLSPKYKMNLTVPPTGRISVAVHVRKGGSYEKYSAAQYKKYDGLLTYKMPDEQYYINQIWNVSEYLGHPPMYAFLFTDDEDPVTMMHRYAAKTNLPNIEFDCRKTGNRHDANVLEDFYSLMEFECLIRSDSNFSIMAEKLGDFSIVISPAIRLPGENIQDGFIKLKDSRKQTRMSSLIPQDSK